MPSKRASQTAPLEDAVPETPFYIPATGPASRPRRTLKCADCFAVMDSHGDIGASAGGPDGVFYADTRFLSRLEMSLNGMQPLLLGSNVRDDNTVLTVDLTNPDLYVGDKLLLPKDMLHIVRTVFLWNETAYQRFALRNHGDRPIGVHLSLSFGNDFADLFEVRGVSRKRRGVAQASVVGLREVQFSYDGLDGRTRRTTICFSPAPTQLAATSASYRLTLPPGEQTAIFLSISCDQGEKDPTQFYGALLSAHRDLKRATRNVATVTTSNDLFNEVLCRSMSDLYMLMSATPQGPYPYAGTPWYSTTFGRDGIITALQMLWFDPAIARGVLRRLAFYQAKARDPEADAQPGKILHEMREGEMAALHEVPFGLYYGSVDSTPLFVMLAGLYAQRTGDWQLIEELWPVIEAALAWIDT
jgi:glycogen debranching enzyme